MVKSHDKFLIAIVSMCITFGAVAASKSTETFKLPLDKTPEPSYKFLNQCAKKMNDVCGREIFVGMFYDEPLTKPCCTRLITMGRECHDALVKKLLQIAQEPIVSTAFHKSGRIWNVCKSNAKSP